VTTFSDAGYEKYARTFLQSCDKFLDATIDMVVYVDNVDPGTKRVQTRQLESCAPELTQFKQRNAYRDSTEFKYSAIRFSHKVYAMCHAARTMDCDMLVWLDADTEMLSPVTPQTFLSKLDAGYFVAYLDRMPVYTETGFLAFDMRCAHAQEFFNRMQAYYDTDAVFDLDQWHDCYVFDAVRTQMQSEGKIQGFNVAPPVRKNHFNMLFKGTMIHYKGDRKTMRDVIFAKEQKKLIKARVQ
jgi:hypothetical protein